MKKYEYAIKDIKFKRVVLLFFSTFILLLTTLVVWGIIESDFNLITILPLSLIAVLFIWLARKLLKTAGRMKNWLDAIYRGDVEKGQFVLTRKMEAVRYDEDISKTVFKIEVLHIVNKNKKIFYVDKHTYANIQEGEQYTIEFIDGYQMALHVLQ